MCWALLLVPKPKTQKENVEERIKEELHVNLLSNAIFTSGRLCFLLYVTNFALFFIRTEVYIILQSRLEMIFISSRFDGITLGSCSDL